MNDIRKLLSEVVSEDLRASYRWPDAEPDITRGHALLVRRRRRFALAGGTGMVAAAVAGALLLTGTPASRSAPVAGANGAPAKDAVALVAYHGPQPKGYWLKTIPQGWGVASADNTALVLHKIHTPKGGSYEDKVVIQGDLNPFPKSGDQAVEVNGHKGWFFSQKGTGTAVHLIFKTDQMVDTTGKADPSHPAGTPLNVLVQLPHSLNWNVATLVKFASGVTVANGAGGAAG